LKCIWLLQHCLALPRSQVINDVILNHAVGRSSGGVKNSYYSAYKCYALKDWLRVLCIHTFSTIDSLCWDSAWYHFNTTQIFSHRLAFGQMWDVKSAVPSTSALIASTFLPSCLPAGAAFWRPIQWMAVNTRANKEILNLPKNAAGETV
jgi:hypothetical protein